MHAGHLKATCMSFYDGSQKIDWVYKYKLTVRQLQTLVVKVLKGQMDRPKKICVQ